MSIKLLVGFVLFFLVLLPLTVYLWKKAPILLPGMLTLCLGVSLNMIVICTNEYKMPVVVFGEGVEFDVADATHSAVSEKTKFLFLADHIHVTSPIFNKGHINILSIGDILIYMGTDMMLMYCVLLLICHKFQNLFPKITEMTREP
ncbi:MAG: DUF5317 family protein [Patescibacteria group bacterium]